MSVDPGMSLNCLDMFMFVLFGESGFESDLVVEMLFIVWRVQFGARNIVRIAWRVQFWWSNYC